MTEYIRTMHPYGFRAGEWAEIKEEFYDVERGRNLYKVEFEDGTIDYWVVDDENGHYEFTAD